MVVFRFWDRSWHPFRESKIFFSQNLTYKDSFLGGNLPGITMAYDSLHNYFGITVKSRKNNKKFGFFEFWLWCRNNIRIIYHYDNLRWISPQKRLRSTFFPQKKKIPFYIPKLPSSEFETEPETPFENGKFFFLKI